MKKSIALLISFLMVLTLLPAVALAANVNDWSGVINSSDSDITLLTSVTITGGTYDLEGKTVTFSGTATISGNVTITNGTILRGAGNTEALFSVSGTGNSLTLSNITVDGQKSTVTANMPLVNISTGGTVTLGEGATLTNNKSNGGGEGSAVTVDDGSLHINGGSIKDNVTTACNNGGGTIKTYHGATVTMTGGEISGNSGAKHGGAIQLYGANRNVAAETKPVTFTMSGGTISGNSLGFNEGVGGGVAISNNATFVMTGGTITGNSCDSSGKGGGVAFADGNNTSMQISGSATITGNTAGGITNNLYIGTNSNNMLKVIGELSGANIGITTNRTNAFTQSEPTITPSTYITQFSADNTDYYVADNGSGQLQLKEKTNTIAISDNLPNTADAGAELTVAASVTGSTAVSYQWYSCTGEDKSGASAISSATQNNYTIPADLSPGNHYYFCRVSADGANPVDSNVVKVTKAATYTVTYTDGVGGAVFANQVYDNLTAGTPTPAFNGTPSRSGFTFTGWSPSVAATVTSDATYTAQWRKNSTTAGSDSSNSPAITSPTTDQEVFVYVNSNATMSIDAKDAKTYQWYVDRGNGFEAISGATDASYTTSKVELKNDGYRYYCVATNAYGTDISPIFTLNVTKDIVTPKTGDNAQNGLWTGLIMIAAAGLCACTVVWRKRSQA